jgi:hypothetical protein
MSRLHKEGVPEQALHEIHRAIEGLPTKEIPEKLMEIGR